MNDSSQLNGRNSIQHERQLIGNAPTNQAKETEAETTFEDIPLTSAFHLTDRLTIFSYLVTTNRVRWYRVIMRVFLQSHRELYRYQLTAQEVRDSVRSSLDPDYTLEQCQSDLAALKDWGNITTIYDSSRASSIASFLSPALLYQATPEAIAIETFLDEQTRASSGRGSLRQSDLPHLWRTLLILDEDLQLAPAELTDARRREIAEQWQRAFEMWNTMAREAAQYLANMISAAQQGRPDLESYQVYKAAVVAYVHGFAQALTQYSRRVRELLAGWSKTGKQQRLIDIAAEFLEPPSATPENRRAQAELLQEAHNQFEAITNWFAESKNADSFRRNALAEVDKVVRRAAALAAAARPNANYVANLNALAQTLLSARNGETAQQLFSVAFANLLPLHLPESMTGPVSAAYDSGKASVWQEPPAVTLHLRPIGRAYRGVYAFEDPIIDNRSIIRNLIIQNETRIREKHEHLAQLFADAYLDTGLLKRISAADRAIVTEVIDTCLSNSSHQYQAADGAIIVLLNPNEDAYTMLYAADGVLLLPRYRLQRLTLDEVSA